MPMLFKMKSLVVISIPIELFPGGFVSLAFTSGLLLAWQGVDTANKEVLFLFIALSQQHLEVDGMGEAGLSAEYSKKP